MNKIENKQNDKCGLENNTTHSQKTNYIHFSNIGR